MNKYACKYVALRFSPYSETEEFANVGIVMYSKTNNKFLYKLDSVDVGNRVAKFFHFDDKKLYKYALDSYEKELSYMMGQVNNNLMDSEAAFNLLVKPRATILSYSSPRVLMTHDINLSLDNAFNRMVRHSTDSQIKTRKNLRTELKNQLNLLKLELPFRQFDFNKNGFVARCSFTQLNDKNHALKLIQPIDLYGKDSAKEVWAEVNKQVIKLERMKMLEILPNNVLLPFSLSSDMNDEALDAWDSVKNEWSNFGELVDIEDSKKVRDFAN